MARIPLPEGDQLEVVTALSLRPDFANDPPALSELQEHCRLHLAGYKVPRAVVFVDSTVRSPSGKPDYPWAKQVADTGTAPSG